MSDEMVIYEGVCPDCGAAVTMHMPGWLPPPKVSLRCDPCAAFVLVAKAEPVEKESDQAFRARRLAGCGIPDLGAWRRELAWNLGEVRDWVWKRRYVESLYVANRQSRLGKTWGCFEVAAGLALEGEDVVWVDCAEWFRETCSLLARDGEEAERRIRLAKGCSLLVLDDLGKQQQTARASEILWDVMNVRTRAMRRRTWITTNMDGAELAEFVGVRFETVRARLQDGFEVWVPKGE